MSYYTTVALSFNWAEFSGEEGKRQRCAPLRALNALLRKQGEPTLHTLTSSFADEGEFNAVLYGAIYNHLDLDGFWSMVLSQEWSFPTDVQMLVWFDDAGRFELYRAENWCEAAGEDLPSAVEAEPKQKPSRGKRSPAKRKKKVPSKSKKGA